jgi:hypothetical protein
MYRPPPYGYGRGPPILNEMKPPPPKDNGLPIVPIIIGIVVIVGIIIGIYMYSNRNKSSTTTTSSNPNTVSPQVVSTTSSKSSTFSPQVVSTTSSNPSTSSSQVVSTTSSSFSTGGGGDIDLLQSGGGGGGDKAVPDEKMSSSGTVYQQFKSKETNKYLYVKSDNTLGLIDTVANADTFNITNGSMKSSKTGLYVKDPNNTGQNPPMTNTEYAKDITWDGTYIKVGTKCIMYDGSGLRIKPCTTNDQSKWIPTIVSSGSGSGSGTRSSGTGTGTGTPIPLEQYVKFKSVADPTMYINVNTTPNPDRIAITNGTPSKFAIIGGKFQSQVQTNGANLCAGSGTGENPKIGACTDQTAVTFRDADGTLQFGNNYLYYDKNANKLTMGTTVTNYKWKRET